MIDAPSTSRTMNVAQLQNKNDIYFYENGCRLKSFFLMCYSKEAVHFSLAFQKFLLRNQFPLNFKVFEHLTGTNDIFSNSNMCQLFRCCILTLAPYFCGKSFSE